jgi:hypothetical protein
MRKLKCVTLLSIIVIFSVNACGMKSSLISKKIKGIQTNTLASEYGGCKHYFITSYDKLRSEVDFIDKIKPNLKNDTVFILESHDIACLSTDLHVTIWNKKKLVSFKKEKLDIGSNKVVYKNMLLTKSDNSFFIKYMIKLVTKWDIEELRKEEKTHGFVSCDLVVATRVIFRDGKYKIDCISFCEFADLQRDIYEE